MSETAEDFKFLRRILAEERNEIGDANIRMIADLSSELPYYCENKQNSIRIIGIGVNVLVDIFPKSQKYHNIKTDERGRFDVCEMFVRSLFE